ncbi:MAG: LysR family transcriptional regulator [Lautropia sp.]
MDLRQLRYFTVLTEQQHYGRAANLLHVAQPALSRQIRLLEEELGTRLFERHARGATPTQEALFLHERSIYLLRYVDQLKHDMLTRQKDPQGPVVLGLSPGLAQLLALRLTRALRDAYPKARIKVHEAFAPSLHSMLLKGSVDLAILNEPVPGGDVALNPLLSESICLIGRPGELPAAKRIRMRQLAGIPLVLTGIPGSGVRLELEAAAASAGVRLNAVAEVETVNIAKQLVADGIGMTVHFAAAVQRELAAGKLEAIPLENLHLKRVLARSSIRPLSRATEVLTVVIHDVLRELINDGQWPNAKLQMR